MTEITNDKDNSVVLVVDDNEQNLELLLAYLEDVECGTLSAPGGVEFRMTRPKIGMRNFALS